MPNNLNFSNWYQGFIDNIAMSLANSPEIEQELDNLLSSIPLSWRNSIKSRIVERANQYMEQGGGTIV